MVKNNSYSLPLLIYDGDCALCLRFAQSIKHQKETEHITCVAYQDKNLYEQFPQLDEEQCRAHPHLILEDGSVLFGKMVLEYLINFFPIVKKFSWLLDKEMGKKAVELFYHAASKLHQKLKDDDCPSCGKR